MIVFDSDSEVPQLPSFEIIADALMPLGALSSPAELHGFLCGHLCAGSRFDEGDWMGAAWELLDTVEPPDRDLDDLIADLYATTLKQIKDGNMSFTLLLPADNNEMNQRVQALGQWCAGFLSGFGSSTADLSDPDEEEPDPSINLEETLEDFAAFSHMQVDDEEDEQENEANYYEIIEYVRVAVMNIFMDIGVRANDKNDEISEDEDDTDEFGMIH